MGMVKIVDSKGFLCKKCHVNIMRGSFHCIKPKKQVIQQDISIQDMEIENSVDNLKIFDEHDSEEFSGHGITIYPNGRENAVDSQASAISDWTSFTEQNPSQSSTGCAFEDLSENYGITIYPNGKENAVDSQASTISDWTSFTEQNPSQSSTGCVLKDLSENYGITIYPNGKENAVDSQASTISSSSSITDNYSQSSICSSTSSTSSGCTINNSVHFKLPKPIMKISIPSSIATHNKCFICRKKSKKRVPMKAIVSLFAHKQVIVPIGNRCCPSHLDEDSNFESEELENIVKICNYKNYTEMSSDNVKKLFFAFSKVELGNTKMTVTFNEDSHYTTKDYKQLTGLSKEDFDDLFKIISPSLKDSCNRSARNAFGVFMMKLRTNLSQETLSILFGMSSQSRVSDTFESVRQAFEKHFVPHYLGYDHLSRGEAIAHQSLFLHKLFQADENPLCAMADGTYLYIEKPSDHNLQKKTFSAHKKRNLLKPMAIILPVGYILNSEGLYYADGTNNDATILKSLAQAETEFTRFFRPGDFFILDRGFRDAIEELNAKGYATFMPNLLAKKQAQFTTLEGNESRKVTMVRWLIEGINGQIKKFKMLDDVIAASYIPKLGSIFRIVCAIINKYSKRVFRDSDESLKMVERALTRMDLENTLQNNVEIIWDLEKKTACWELANRDTVVFPKLSKSALKKIAMGPYQLNQAKLYTRRHMKTENEYSIFTHKDISGLIFAKMESRFTKGKVHKLWIQFDTTLEDEDAVTSYYCKCRVGARTLGICCHIASVLWFLGWARHQEEDLVTKGRNLAGTILDAAEELERHLESQSSQENSLIE